MGHEVTADVTDATITAHVKAALAAEPGVSSLKIHVTTMNKVVHLKGKVMSDDQMHAIVKTVKDVKGVVSVDSSQLNVKK